MTNEQAKSELMQIYMSLSEEKKKALDVAFKAMEQADNIPVMYYPQVDGITPTVVAQADGEKTCGTCRNEDTYHCAECENKSDYEQSQADGEYKTEKSCKTCKHYGVFSLECGRCDKDMTNYSPKQADGEYISRTAIEYINAPIAPVIQGEEVHYEWVAFRKQIEQLPSVGIPPDHDGCKDCRWQSQSEIEMPCKQCMHNYTDEWERAKTGHWIWQTEDIYQCSECHEDIHVKEVMNKPQYAWCPICGCPMEIER